MAHTASAALPWSGLCYPPGLVTLPQSLIIFTCKSSSTREEKSVWPCRCLLRKKREENCKIATDVSGIKHQILLQLVIGLTFPLRRYYNNIFIISLFFFFSFSSTPHVETIIFLNIWKISSILPKKGKVHAWGIHFVSDRPPLNLNWDLIVLDEPWKRGCIERDRVHLLGKTRRKLLGFISVS